MTDLVQVVLLDGRVIVVSERHSWRNARVVPSAGRHCACFEQRAGEFIAFIAHLVMRPDTVHALVQVG